MAKNMSRPLVKFRKKLARLLAIVDADIAKLAKAAVDRGAPRKDSKRATKKVAKKAPVKK